MIETTDIRVLTDDEMLAVAGGHWTDAARAAAQEMQGSPAVAVIEGLVNTVRWAWPL